MRQFIKLLVISCSLILLQSKLSADPPITIIAWNYYFAPPFMTPNNQGLALDFVNLLNKESDGRFRFQLLSIPRVRLDQYLDNHQQGIVLFVNWAWMGKGAKENFLWTPKILRDRNEIISSIDKKIVFDSPDSLKGLIFGAIRGRKYKNLEELFTTNQIQRFDVNREEQVLALMMKNRIDVTSQPRTLAIPLSQSMGLKDKIFFSPKPLFSFTRHIMITPKLKEVHAHLSKISKNLENNAEWIAILSKYGLAKK